MFGICIKLNIEYNKCIFTKNAVFLLLCANTEGTSFGRGADFVKVAKNAHTIADIL